MLDMSLTIQSSWCCNQHGTDVVVHSLPRGKHTNPYVPGPPQNQMCPNETNEKALSCWFDKPIMTYFSDHSVPSRRYNGPFAPHTIQACLWNISFRYFASFAECGKGSTLAVQKRWEWGMGEPFGQHFPKGLQRACIELSVFNRWQTRLLWLLRRLLSSNAAVFEECSQIDAHDQW